MQQSANWTTEAASMQPQQSLMNWACGAGREELAERERTTIKRRVEASIDAEY
jgi:hypothetical protein